MDKLLDILPCRVAGGFTSNEKVSCAILFFFFTLVTGPTRSLSLKLSDTRVYEPQNTSPPRNEKVCCGIAIVYLTTNEEVCYGIAVLYSYRTCPVKKNRRARTNPGQTAVPRRGRGASPPTKRSVTESRFYVHSGSEAGSYLRLNRLVYHSA